MTEGRELVTQGEAARRLGMTRQNVARWCGKAGAPLEHRDGQLWLVWPDFAVWVRAALEAGRQRPTVPLEAARTRRTLAQAGLLEWRLAQRRAELMTPDDAASDRAALVARIRKVLEAAPATWAPRVTGTHGPAEAQGKLMECVRGTLVELQKTGADDGEAE